MRGNSIHPKNFKPLFAPTNAVRRKQLTVLLFRPRFRVIATTTRIDGDILRTTAAWIFYLQLHSHHFSINLLAMAPVQRSPLSSRKAWSRGPDGRLQGLVVNLSGAMTRNKSRVTKTRVSLPLADDNPSPKGSNGGEGRKSQRSAPMNSSTRYVHIGETSLIRRNKISTFCHFHLH